MLSENFDHKIKQSLDQRPEGMDNPQWDKMETLLDKHLPQKKDDRRRIIFFMLILLLAGGSAFFIWKNNGDGKNTLATKEKQTEQSESKNETKELPAANTDTKNNTAAENLNAEEKNITGKEINNATGSANKTIFDKNEIESSENFEITQSAPGTVTKKKSKPAAEKPLTKEPVAQKANPPAILTEKENTTAKNINTEDKNLTQQTETVNTQQQTEIKKAAEEQKQQAVAETKQPEQKTDTKEQPATAAVQNQKKKNSFINNLFFTISAGPDVSSVGFNNAGKLKPIFGAGIGYQVSKKISIRTGFYTARKVYSAGPQDYDPPANFWSYYSNLKNIDADCKVYEIPVTVDFVFANKKNNSWFVSAGLSTLLMKKETYEYYFKPNYSPNYITYTKVHENENKHYFSVLNFSGGYRKAVSKTISLQAEPYLKIATTGIGYGKVNLNSSGILFSAIIKPFAAKNK